VLVEDLGPVEGVFEIDEYFEIEESVLVLRFDLSARGRTWKEMPAGEIS
jgi:hypothetical protein